MLRRQKSRARCKPSRVPSRRPSCPAEHKRDHFNFTQTLPCGKRKPWNAGTIPERESSFTATRSVRTMTDDETIHIGQPEAEFRRQMRSGQMKRFVDTLPAFAVDRDMPDRFARLLRQLDRVPPTTAYERIQPAAEKLTDGAPARRRILLSSMPRGAFQSSSVSPCEISVPKTLRHSRMKAARPGQPLAETRLPSTCAPLGATSIYLPPASVTSGSQ